MHIAEVVTIAKSLPLLRLNTYKSLILSYSADYRRILCKNLGHTTSLLCSRVNNCDLAFEYSSVHATIKSAVHSVKNPRTGCITAESYGQIILDEHIKAPGDCELKLWDGLTCFSD